MMVQFKLKSHHWITITSFCPRSIECLEWNTLECLQKTLVLLRNPQKNLVQPLVLLRLGCKTDNNLKYCNSLARHIEPCLLLFPRFSHTLNNISVVSHSSYANILKLGFAHFSHSLGEFYLHPTSCNVCDIHHSPNCWLILLVFKPAVIVWVGQMGKDCLVT